MAQLLSHQAGLPVIDAPLPAGAAADWGFMVRALEHQVPVWTPGTATGYHAVTFNWLVGELVRRVTGASLGEFVRTQIATPLGIERWIGHRRRSMRASRRSCFPPPGRRCPSPRTRCFSARCLLAPHRSVHRWIRARFRAMELCSTNGLTHAGALARLYGVLASGGAPLLRSQALDESIRERVRGRDVVVGDVVRRGCCWTLANGVGRTAWGPGIRTFGHTGAGGALGFADPDRKIGFAYTPSKIRPGTAADARCERLIDALYRCAG